MRLTHLRSFILEQTERVGLRQAARLPFACPNGTTISFIAIIPVAITTNATPAAPAVVGLPAIAAAHRTLAAQSAILIANLAVGNVTPPLGVRNFGMLRIAGIRLVVGLFKRIFARRLRHCAVALAEPLRRNALLVEVAHGR